MSEDSNKVTYCYSFKKRSSYKGRPFYNTGVSGKNTLVKSKIDHTCDSYVFSGLLCEQERVKEPILIDPLQWVYNKEFNEAIVQSKEDFKLVFDDYVSRHRNWINNWVFKIFEERYFVLPKGIEDEMLSNGVSQPFFMNALEEYIVGKAYKGPDYISLPINLPLHINYICTSIDDKYIVLSGKIAINESGAEKMYKKNGMLRVVHQSLHPLYFDISSQITVRLDKMTGMLVCAIYQSQILGERKLKEKMWYCVCSEAYMREHKIIKLADGMMYTQEEWDKEETKPSKGGFWSFLRRG